MHIGNLTVSPIDPATKFAEDIFSLVCSADIHPLPTSIHGELSLIEWFFDNSSLPSGVTVSNVTKSGNTTYTNVLQFSPLHKTYTGVYTCRIGSRAISTTIAVVGKDSLHWLNLMHLSMYCPTYSSAGIIICGDRVGI